MFNCLKNGVSVIFSLVILLFSCDNCVKADGFANVMFVGNYSGGKTQIFRRIFGELFLDDSAAQKTSYASNVIMNLRSIKDDSVITVRIWDTPGSKEYYDEIVKMVGEIRADIVCIVHDLSQSIDSSSVTGSENMGYFNMLFRDIKDRSPGCKLIFVGSKKDLCKSKASEFAANKAMLALVVDFLADDDKDCSLILTSAKTGAGISELVRYIMVLLQRDTDRTYNRVELIDDPTMDGSRNEQI